jgi:hypothetical protein
LQAKRPRAGLEIRDTGEAKREVSAASIRDKRVFQNTPQVGCYAYTKVETKCKYLFNLFFTI